MLLHAQEIRNKSDLQMRISISLFHNTRIEFDPLTIIMFCVDMRTHWEKVKEREKKATIVVENLKQSLAKMFWNHKLPTVRITVLVG